jgi:hypothetical protein
VREEIGVIEAWLKAYGLITPQEVKPQAWSKAESDLELAYARFTEALAASGELKPRATFAQRIEVLLLINSAEGWLAKFMRILYYISLAMAATWIGVIVGISAAQSSGWGGLVIGYAVFLAANLLISGGIYALVHYLNGRARTADITSV